MNSKRTVVELSTVLLSSSNLVDPGSATGSERGNHLLCSLLSTKRKSYRGKPHIIYFSQFGFMLAKPVRLTIVSFSGASSRRS